MKHNIFIVFINISYNTVSCYVTYQYGIVQQALTPPGSYKSESFEQVRKIHASTRFLGIQTVRQVSSDRLRSNREVKIKQELKWLNMQEIVIHSDMAT